MKETLIQKIIEEINLDIQIKSLLEIKKLYFNKRYILNSYYHVENVSNDSIKISYENWGYNFIKIDELEKQNIKPWIVELIKKNSQLK